MTTAIWSSIWSYRSAPRRGVFRLFTPFVARNLPKTIERITSQMVALVESRP
jgi:hypothetical protein